MFDRKLVPTNRCRTWVSLESHTELRIWVWISLANKCNIFVTLGLDCNRVDRSQNGTCNAELLSKSPHQEKVYSPRLLNQRVRNSQQRKWEILRNPLLKIKSTSILFNAALNNAIVSRGISSLKLSEISSNESGKNWKTKICQTEKKQIQSIISTNYALYFAVSFVSWRLADRYGELILVNGMHFVNRERYRENKNKCMDCLSGQKKYLCVKVI